MEATGTETNQPERNSTESSHPEDRLSKTWRHLISSVFHATSKAEQTTADVASIKEIDDAVVAFLRARLEWGRNISFLEAKFEGKAKEMEVLQHYSRTQPCLGLRKRKREVVKENDVLSVSQTIQTAASTQEPVATNPSNTEQSLI
ncbi:hypothetical protein FisN_20Hu234 [Fistulifera solaris]|uniref:Uncharacterized protein n=1 Tax=Fistulifera solaris TaxID=1519565 RepID=A0A1Z5JQ52_FISSO|nr:hypothetical protein FisN_20Hu234 [Fistulifera solaris]|eukprot:GAX16089.1 hypothetical protein FisN_20Hu234 [Fistulifera solaris]